MSNRITRKIKKVVNKMKNVMTIDDIKDRRNVYVTFPVARFPEKRVVGYGILYEATVPSGLCLINSISVGSFGPGVALYVRGVSCETWIQFGVQLLVDTKIELASDETVAQIKVVHQKIKNKDMATYLQHSFMIGADPEIFIEDADKETIIPAFEFLPSKETSDIYWDGFQAEFTTQPRGCIEQHCAGVASSLKRLLQMAKKYNSKAILSNRNMVEVPMKALLEGKEAHVQLGCLPSLNAYGLKGEKVINGRELPFRSAGGHIHFGIGKMTEEEATPLIKALDAILGVSCVALFANFDNPARREYYGQAGEYRLPPHGLEYRTLSNAWLIHPLLKNMVFDLARKALKFGEQGYMPMWNATEEETIKVIQTCDVEGAQKIMKRNKETIMNLFAAAYRVPYGIFLERYKTENGTPDKSYITLAEKQLEAVFNVFYNGLESAIKNPKDIANNWKLNDECNYQHNEVGHEFSSSKELLVAGKKAA